MPVDATGIPTSLGIPKLDTSVDNPTGDGENAMMDAIDALFLQTPSAASIAGIAVGSVPVWNGSAWVKPTGTPDGSKGLRDDGVWAGLGGASGYGTSLPGSPADGIEFVLTDNVSAPTYQWRLRYNAGSASSFKWEFVGGSPAISLAAAAVNIKAHTTYTDNNGPSFTLPRAGDYDITIAGTLSGFGDNSGAITAYHSYAIGATAASDNDAWVWGTTVLQEVIVMSFAAKRRKTGLSASDLVEERTKVSRSTGSNWNLSQRYLLVTPVRVS